MKLDLLASREDTAAANMATDFMLLQHYPHPAHARLRHYGWRRPAFTFGYAQNVAAVRAQIGRDGDDAELCRRPTGGGIVDHREDWTYALVLPREHDLGAAPAPQSYAAIHDIVAGALRDQGCNAVLQPPATTATAGQYGGASACFTRAEPADVIHAVTKAKIAGAAQKRSKRGLLFQGSIARRTAGDIDWDQFEESFAAGVAQLLALPAAPVPWPELWDAAVDSLAENYASEAWLERR